MTTVASRISDLATKLTDTNSKETATTVSQVVLGFAVPFAVQAGMGASIEASAMRAGLQGLIGGVAIGGGFLARLYLDPTSSLHDYYDYFSPLLVAGIYAASNDVMALSKSQGPLKDFTFSAVSGYAVYGLQPLTHSIVRSIMEKKKVDAAPAAPAPAPGGS
jgi:hypothetical protein